MWNEVTPLKHPILSITNKIRVEMILSDSKNNHAAPHDIKTDVMKKIV